MARAHAPVAVGWVGAAAVAGIAQLGSLGAVLLISGLVGLAAR